MKIKFDKVGSSEKPFEIESEGIHFGGSLRKDGYHRVALKARIYGDIALDCDRCGNSYNHKLDNSIALSLRDEVLKDKEDLDIIEFLDGMIDISYILESEVNAQKSTYHHCPKCDSSEESIEIEF
ncbi:MAG: DUF177 domain-containing protein [Sulfurovum sp.]|nr:DUF177 domain-containing protein [Sulfurovum sp.]